VHVRAAHIYQDIRALYRQAYFLVTQYQFPCQIDAIAEVGGISNNGGNGGDSVSSINGTRCNELGLPHPTDSIPLPPAAYERDLGQSANFVMGVLANKGAEMTPPMKIHIAIPRLFSGRIDGTTGAFDKAGNSDNTWKRAGESTPEDGVFEPQTHELKHNPSVCPGHVG